MQRIEEFPLEQLKDHPENDVVYDDRVDADLLDLIRSIKEKGLLEPLVITRDDYILSGHRRRSALVFARLELIRDGIYDGRFDSVPVRREPFPHDSPEALSLLVSYNKQRKKTMLEEVRESVVLSNPDPAETHRALIEQRERESRPVDDPLEFKPRKDRSGIGPNRIKLAEQLRLSLENNREFWPFTDRQLFYTLLNLPEEARKGLGPLPQEKSKRKPKGEKIPNPDAIFRNDKECYDKLCKVLTLARTSGMIPWDAIDDETRPCVDWRTYDGPGEFCEGRIRAFSTGYRRNIHKGQPAHVEIVAEKNTVHSHVARVAGRYAIPYTICRGFCSLAPQEKIARRFLCSGKRKMTVLFLSDFDADGHGLMVNFAQRFSADFGVDRSAYEIRKVCITEAQAMELRSSGAPAQFVRKTSSRAELFAEAHSDSLEHHGAICYELEAIHPQKLMDLLEDAVLGSLDADVYNAEIEREARDSAELSRMGEYLKEALRHYR